MRMSKRLVGLFVVLMVVALAAPPVLAGATWVKTRVGLKATALDPLASGKAVFREAVVGSRNKVEVEVEDVFSTTNVDVFVDAVNIGTIALVGGKGQIELDTENGDTVPAVQVGMFIKIKDTVTGDLLLKRRHK